MSGLRHGLGEIRRAFLCAVHSRSVPWENRPPAVTFTFDDFPRSAYLVGGPILRDAGASGTYYAAASLAGTTNALGEQFVSDDLSTLLSEGHELGSHTFSHLSSRRTPYAAFADDVFKGRAALREMCKVEDSGNFAYPYGEATAYAKGKLGPTLTSCRGTIHGINFPAADLNLLRANPLYGGDEIVPTAETLIDSVVRRGGWLIFYTHDVQERPSHYGCTPSALRKVVEAVRNKGARILTVAQATAGLAGIRNVSRGTAD